METVSVTLDLPARGADRDGYLAALVKAKRVAGEHGDTTVALAIAHLIFHIAADNPLPVFGVRQDD
jgi:hypothetical protein